MIVAVKVMNVVKMRRFLREVETCLGLRHGNIVRCYGANHRTRPCFIVMQYAENGELMPYLKRKKRENGETLAWQKMREVAVGLAYLHKKGIVHGDLKGNNIVVDDRDRSMLTDFGSSFAEGGSCSLVKMKDSLGTMAWRAPGFAEMTADKTPTHKSDICSLGICIIEAVTEGRHMWFQYRNDYLRENLGGGDLVFERPDALTDDQWALVQRMITHSPQDRPEMGEILEKLKQFAADEACPY